MSPLKAQAGGGARTQGGGETGEIVRVEGDEVRGSRRRRPYKMMMGSS